MAATVSCRGRGAALVRKPKDLLLIFILLNVLCPATSWIDKDNMKEIQENILKLQQDAVMRRTDVMVDKILLPRILEGVSQLMEPLTETIMHIVLNFRSIPELMKALKSYLDEIKEHIIEYLEKEIAIAKEYEDKAKQLERIITQLAEGKANT